MRRGYVVLDLETTGFSPARNDRIVEIGALYMDPSFAIDGGIETLINPKRDVGPTHIHGITARDVFDAPSFDQVAPNLLKMLDGRVVVGHNIAFDLRFLTAELEREGYEVPDIVAIDTMQVARALLKSDPPPSFKLVDVCKHLDIDSTSVFAHLGLEQRPAHSAFGDAAVTAFVLSRLAHASLTSNYWNSHLDAAEQVAWPECFETEVTVKPRQLAQINTENSAPFSPHRTVVEVFTALGAPAPSRERTLEYSALLDATLDDRILNSSEVEALIETASRLGLDSATLGSLHRGHFDEAVRTAWSDGVLTDAERTDIAQLSQILGIDDDSLHSALNDDRTNWTPSRQSPPSTLAPAETIVGLSPGSIIVLTGDMSIERSHLERQIVALGHVVGNQVTKKTAMVIAADPFTQSSKAKKARDYGIPVYDETEGFRLIRS